MELARAFLDELMADRGPESFWAWLARRNVGTSTQVSTLGTAEWRGYHLYRKFQVVRCVPHQGSDHWVLAVRRVYLEREELANLIGSPLGVLLGTNLSGYLWAYTRPLPEGLAQVDNRLLELGHARETPPAAREPDGAYLVCLPHYRLGKAFFPEDYGPMLDNLASRHEYLVLSWRHQVHVASLGPERRARTSGMVCLGYQRRIRQAYDRFRLSPERFLAWINSYACGLAPGVDLARYYTKLLSEALYGRL